MSNRMSSRKQDGFTLIELMMIVAILAIIAAVAIPSYRSHVVKANRTAAESFILGVANKQEQYILDARSYASSLGDLGMTTPSDISKNYTISISGVTAAPPAYTIIAAPTGKQADDDTKCGTVSIDQTGTKNKTGTGAVADCW